jgi:hypothetical protein
MQKQLAAQLRDLGVRAGTAELVALFWGSGSGEPTIPATGVTYALAAGDFAKVSGDIGLCGVILDAPSST